MESHPEPRLVLQAAVLRRWRISDREALSLAIDQSVDHLRPWMWWAQDEAGNPVAQRDFLTASVASFDQGHEFGYGLFDTVELQVLGGFGLHPREDPATAEIGYWLHVAHTGRGLATEAVRAVVAAAFRRAAMERIEIRCDPTNARSAAVPRRLGFQLETVIDTPIRAPGETGRKQVWVMRRTEHESAA